MASARDSTKIPPRSGTHLDPVAVGAKADETQAQDPSPDTRARARAARVSQRAPENTITMAGATRNSAVPKSRGLSQGETATRNGGLRDAEQDNTLTDATPGAARVAGATTGQKRPDRDNRGTERASPASRESADGAAPSDANPDRATMPDHINGRYLKVGDDYHFADGTLAFRDRGRGLSTPLENVEVVRDLVAIARERGWTHVTIAGTERFRKEAWQHARLAGLEVRGHSPSELERKQLAHRSGLRSEPNREADSPVIQAAADAQPANPPVVSPEPSRAIGARHSRPLDRLHRGRLVEHGVARYQFDPRAEESYYVLLETAQGEEYLWGKDLGRALKASLSQAREDQNVVVRQLGAEAVTVRRPVQDENGRMIEAVQVRAHRNRWSVETQEFIEARSALAQVVRDPAISAKAAVLKHPELGGTYADLHVAQLVAENQGYTKEGVQRFVNRTREAIAQEIERGEALTPPIDAARYRGTAPTPRTHQRIQERVL